MNSIILAVIIVAAIGLITGTCLAIASIVMKVPVDEKVEALNEVLPGANCGACGLSGCADYALAMANGTAEPGLCSPGGQECADACGKILGKTAELKAKTALVNCRGSYDFTDNKMIYEGINTCAASDLLAGGVASCRFGCIGMGDCMRACEYGAIKVCDGVAIINPKLCKGCSKCVVACPRSLITFVPLKKQAVIRCSNCDKGAGVTKICKIGCIGCRKCEKVCPAEAVSVTNFNATVNADKCIGCGLCVEACPRKLIDLIQV